MTEKSFYWGGISVGDAVLAPYDDDEFSDLWRKLFMTDRTIQGVINGYNNELVVANSVSPVSVATGAALVDGKFYENDASADVAVPTPASSTRIDLIVLRKTWATQEVRITRVAGTEGGGAPSLTQNDGVTWDVPLAQVSITTGGTITVTDMRYYTRTPLAPASIWLAGRGAIGPLTNGFSTAAQVEMTTNKQNISAPSFPTGSQKYAEWEVFVPTTWKVGTFKARFHWIAANSTSTNSVVWGIQARAYADGDNLDQAWGTAREVTDANHSTAYDVNISDWTTVVTPAGSPVPGQFLKIRGYRLGSGSDNLAVAAYLLGVELVPVVT